MERSGRPDLSGMTFRAVANSPNGSLNSETEMRFTDDEAFVAGTYGGGTIATGHVLGKRSSATEIDLLYHGATTSGAVEAGKAHATFEPGADGRWHMLLDWQWLTGDLSSGRSEWVQT